MSEWIKYALKDVFPFSLPGEWGFEPDSLGNALALRAADFTKDCKLKQEIGVTRSIPKLILNQKQLINGDILIEKSGGSPDQPVGRVVFFDRGSNDTAYIHSNFLQLLRVAEGFDKRFCYYLLAHLYQSGYVFGYQQQTTGIINLKLENYLKEVVPLPARAQQQKIARILQTIDQAIETTEALIGKYQQIKAGLMHDLFTRGIGADGKLRPPREQAPELYKKTPIGWIPREWEYELLDDLALRGSGHTPSKSHSIYWNGGIKWLSLADSSNLDQLYISDTAFEISELGIKKSSAVLHPTGMVVLSRDAGIGKSAITKAPMAVSQHFMCWKCGEALDNHFLYYWLQNNKRLFENIAMGSTILTIGLSYFKRLRISCPFDVAEQRAIAERLKLADMKIFTLYDDLRKKKKQKAGLMHDLLNCKVPVQVELEAKPEAVNA